MVQAHLDLRAEQEQAGVVIDKDGRAKNRVRPTERDLETISGVVRAMVSQG
jgi:hypothetical protein